MSNFVNKFAKVAKNFITSFKIRIGENYAS